VQILIFLAALQKMDKQIFEAAKIDGASNWEFFWKITLPSLTPMIIVNLIYTIVTYSIFSLNPIIEHIQKNMFKVDTGFGYASALSWIYFLIIALALVITVGLMTLKGKKSYT
jgi:ABC-type sugar transport system permease subunit